MDPSLIDVGIDPGNLQNLIEQVAVLRRDADPRLDFRFPPQCMNHREKLDRLGSGPKNHDDFLLAQNFSQPQIVHHKMMLASHGLIRMKRSEEHTSELQSLMRISYAVFCLKKK